MTVHLERMQRQLDELHALLRQRDEGLGTMEEAIRYVDERGQQFGDSPAWLTGDAGF